MTEPGGSRIDWGRWARRVLTWDAAMPVLVGLAPIAVEWALPGRRVAVELLALILPIVAFFCRIVAGKRQIDGNACSPGWRRAQLGFLCAGILPMVLVECFLTLASIMPNGVGELGREGMLVFGGFIAFYIGCMVIAMYPGRTLPARHWGGDEWIGDHWVDEHRTG